MFKLKGDMNRIEVEKLEEYCCLITELLVTRGMIAEMAECFTDKEKRRFFIETKRLVKDLEKEKKVSYKAFRFSRECSRGYRLFCDRENTIFEDVTEDLVHANGSGNHWKGLLLT